MEEKLCCDCKFFDFEEFDDGSFMWCNHEDGDDEDMSWSKPACKHYQEV